MKPGGDVFAASYVPGEETVPGNPRTHNRPWKGGELCASQRTKPVRFLEPRNVIGSGSKYHPENVARLYAIEFCAVTGNVIIPTGS